MTNIDIIPMILTEQAASKIPLEILSEVAGCSTGIVLTYVNEYLSRTEGANRSIQDKIREAYKSINDRNEYLQSEKIKDLTEQLNLLTYQDIHPLVEVSKLKIWRDLIKESFESEYSTPFIPKITKDKFEEMLSKIKEYEGSTEEKMALAGFSDTLIDNKNLFKNAPFKQNKATILRSIYGRKDEYELILHGIDFILPKIEGGINYNTWRRL